MPADIWICMWKPCPTPVLQPGTSIGCQRLSMSEGLHGRGDRCCVLASAESSSQLQFEEVGQAWDLTGNTPKDASPWVHRVRSRACYLQQRILATS